MKLPAVAIATRSSLVVLRLALLAPLALLSLLGPSLGCQTVGRTVAMPAGQPPLPELVAPPSFLTPRSQRYRVAVRPFVDQTGQATGAADAAADVLQTALHAIDRFSLYDAADVDADLPAVSAAPPPDARSAPARARTDVYPLLLGMVDGVLESHVTAIQVDGQGNGHLEVDYRMVDPYSRMVVTSGSARIGLRGGALVRADFTRLADDVSRRFVDPTVLARHEVSVREVSLAGSDVRVTLDAGTAKKVMRGAVGFVVEQDRYTRVDRYLAKFVVVNVFPEAAVGVVVEHCNAVGRCTSGEGVTPVEQAQNVHVGSRVRFK